jgi:N-glycosylase/DNA lyase
MVPVLLAEAAGLHLRRTLDSGQTFRWRWDAAGREVTGIVGRSILRLAQDAAGVWLIAPQTPDARQAVLRYLGVGDHAGVVGIEKALAEDPVLARILPHTSGISLLAQDPWEMTISFIISQNNNIPKITRSIAGLARALGEPLDEQRGPRSRQDPGSFYAFPSPERLAGARAQVLRACLLGYRAPYVRAASRLFSSGRLDMAALQRMPEEEARDTLLRIPGVGEKVADCILLFGLRRITAFPVDVWVRRAVERLYFRNRPCTAGEIQQFARARFGALAGYAQQHLFVYARQHLRPAARTRRALNGKSQ